MAKGSMLDLEKQETENAPLQATPRGDQEQEPLIVADLRVKTIEGGMMVAAKTNPGPRKWLPYWLLAVSVMVLTNHLLVPSGEDQGAAAEDQLIAPVAAKFAVFLCAICLMFCTMKQI